MKGIVESVEVNLAFRETNQTVGNVLTEGFIGEKHVYFRKKNDMCSKDSGFNILLN
jgi:hypothetical protein